MMANHIPVAIGGVGGSGTRVVAEILKRVGLYIGSDLNPSNDNLWFTLLLKRPAWFIKNSVKDETEIYRGLSIFEKAMNGQPVTGMSDLLFIFHATIDIALRGHDHLHSGRGIWAFKRAMNMLKTRRCRFSARAAWGWKEPNTHIFIKYLAGHFKQIKYIHVIRHGLDMAYSSNQAQLFNWGRLFGVVTDSSIPLPKASLQYWIKANKQAIDLGRRLLGKRFLLLNFERLCLNPAYEIDRLLDFLEIGIGSVDIESLVALPRTPKSSGRYKNHDISVFSDEEIVAVKALGFETHSCHSERSEGEESPGLASSL